MLVCQPHALVVCCPHLLNVLSSKLLPALGVIHGCQAVGAILQKLVQLCNPLIRASIAQDSSVQACGTCIKYARRSRGKVDDGRQGRGQKAQGCVTLYKLVRCIMTMHTTYNLHDVSTLLWLGFRGVSEVPDIWDIASKTSKSGVLRLPWR